ncbi:MAG TPA: hypothetical protein VG456_18150 [Candidatus Sulfopaludibacter sp.]|nr:hypothetical protein [Candidatus Sulfopaludibacter sp.]
MHRAILVGVLQCLIVLSIAGKYEWDRERLPRVWVNATPVDPWLPLRGRYVSLSIQVQMPEGYNGFYERVRLYIDNGHLAGTPDAHSSLTVSRFQQRPWVLTEQLAYFIPEHAPDPSRRPAGEELWVEVSVPPHGPPRPLRLAVKKDGKLTLLAGGRRQEAGDRRARGIRRGRDGGAPCGVVAYEVGEDFRLSKIGCGGRG